MWRRADSLPSPHLRPTHFANRLFEPLWCAEHIESVDIVWDETVALEGRAGYYDHTGALRDMIQNHLLQLRRPG